MGRRQTVIRKTGIEQSLPIVWGHLTRPERLARWFADTARFEPGETARFDFGDGDYFAVDGIEMHPPAHLRLKWKFMGVGDLYDVQILLDRENGTTEVTVIDFGATSEEDAEALAEGWTDFLERLRLSLEEGRRTRYRWTETISMAGRLPATSSLPHGALEPHWWRRRFPEANVTPLASRPGVEFRLAEPRWGRIETRGSLRAGRLDDALYLRLEHAGWADLGEEAGLEARRKYAILWSRALGELEDGARRRMAADGS